MATNVIGKTEFLMKEHIELRLFKKIKIRKNYLNEGIWKIIFKTRDGDMREVKGDVMWPLRFAWWTGPCKENPLLSPFEKNRSISESVASQQSLTWAGMSRPWTYLSPIFCPSNQSTHIQCHRSHFSEITRNAPLLQFSELIFQQQQSYPHLVLQ